MRPDIIRTYKVVHTWTGILSGLFLFVAFYAGALTVFEPFLARWATPPVALQPTGLDRAEDLINQTIAVRPQVRRDFTLHLGEDGEIPARMTWAKSPEDEEPMASRLTEDGGVQISRLRPNGLGQFIDDLHRTAGLPVEVELGAAFMGGVSALYLLALVSGIVIIVPSLIRDLFALRIGPNLKRMWMDAHNLVGVISLPFHLVIALSSVVFGLHDEIYGALDRMVYEGNLRKVFVAENPFAAVRRDPRPAIMLPPAELLARLEAAAPGFRPQAMQYRDAGTQGASVTVWGIDDRYLMRGRGFVVMSAVRGDVVNTAYLPGHQNGYGASVAAFFSLHMASFGGVPVKWGYLALGLAGAFLFYSGNLLWVESRRRRDKQAEGAARQSRSTRWMAALTTGVCLGCVIGVSVATIGSKWLHGVVADLGVWQWRLYYGALVLATAWAFLRGAGRAGVDLLWLAASVTFAIPLSSLLAVMLPSLGLWAWQASLGVDLGAAILALSLALLARITARRVRSGPQDSVWSRHGGAAMAVS